MAKDCGFPFDVEGGEWQGELCSHSEKNEPLLTSHLNFTLTENNNSLYLYISHPFLPVSMFGSVTSKTAESWGECEDDGAVLERLLNLYLILGN